MAADSSGISRSAPLFEVTTFEPDRMAPLLGTLLLFGAVTVGGSLCGWLVAHMANIGGCFICCAGGSFIFVMLGVVVAWSGNLAIQFGKIRNPEVAYMAAIWGMLMMGMSRLIVSYYLHLDELRNRPPNPGQPIVLPTFGEYLADRNIIEFIMMFIGLVIGGTSAIVSLAAKTKRPFCKACETWKDEVWLGSLNIAPLLACEIVGQGRLTELAVVLHATHDAKSTLTGTWRWRQRTNFEQTNRNDRYLEITVHYCPRCVSDEPIEIQLQQMTTVKKRSLFRVVFEIFTYPGVALLVLDKLFPNKIFQQEIEPEVRDGSL